MLGDEIVYPVHDLAKKPLLCGLIIEFLN